MKSGGLLDLGRQAEARRNPRCVGCENLLPQRRDASSVLTVSAADVPDFFQCPIGLNVVMTLFLCRGCSHLIETPKKLRSLFLCDDLADSATNISVFRLLDGKMVGWYLEPVPLVRPNVTPLSLFEGRGAFARDLCRNAEGLLKYCHGTEQLGLRTVGCFSSSEDIAAVYNFGLLFGQEQEPFIGPPHWSISPRLIGPTRISYLVMDESHSTYVGAVAFNTLEYHTLAWVWLHPSVRRHGILSRIWPHLKIMHAGFKVQTPLSNGMRIFLAKNDLDQRHELTEWTGGPKEEQ